MWSNTTSHEACGSDFTRPCVSNQYVLLMTITGQTTSNTSPSPHGLFTPVPKTPSRASIDDYMCQLKRMVLHFRPPSSDLTTGNGNRRVARRVRGPTHFGH